MNRRAVATERRPYARTGLNALKARVKVKGLAAIDRRTAGAQELIAWRDQLVADLGGEDDLTAAKRALIDAAARTWLYVSCIDAFLLEQRCLVNRRRRCLLPVVRERQQLVDSLARVLGQLGLERRTRKIPDLQEYVRERYGSGDSQSDLNGKAVVQQEVTAPGSTVVPDLERPDPQEEKPWTV